MAIYFLKYIPNCSFNCFCIFLALTKNVTLLHICLCLKNRLFVKLFSLLSSIQYGFFNNIDPNVSIFSI